jgi:hypothetical protein
MKSSLCSLVPALLLLTLLAGGCSNSNTAAPLAGQVHPAGWEHSHRAAANADLSSCQGCHGADFTGSGKAVSCFTCHASGPPFAIHPTGWNGDALNGHNCFFNDANINDRRNWTNCATAACHGKTLHGENGIAPSCFSASFVNGLDATNSCHASGPAAPHATGAIYANPALHGADAKDAGNVNESMGNYCINCHGRPTNQFDGGMVSDPAILNLPAANCAQPACHPAASAHPTNWVRANNAVRFHSTISTQTRTASCTLCHNTDAPGSGPLTGAPSCFSANFTNANAIASTCHDTGPVGAPHAVPFADPALHGPEAKANLLFCQTCHAAAGGQGSNPRFNTPIGNLVDGCEDCHSEAGAHPSGTDRWTFHYDTTVTRRTHFAAGNVLTACALCHNVSSGNVGGTAPPCTGCHVSAPLFLLKCNVCHLQPPAGTPDQSGASTPVAHGLVATRAPHEACAICHGAKDTDLGSGGKLTAKAAGYLLFDANDATLNQGGNHLDGRLEMNGPSGVGSGYNATNFGCDNACHGNDLAHRLPNASGLPLEFGNYGSGSLACNSCHGYPPDGNPDLTGANPVNHLFGNLGATLKASHNDCLLCHGTKDDGTGSHSPAANYSVAVDHNTGSINMNSATAYNQANFGCDAACHANDAAHRLADSTLPVVLADYGGGGGGASCAACHDTGAGGAPVVKQNVTSHASGQTCEGCHTGHGQGAVIIPNNAAVGINYTAAGHGNGISLGGTATTGTTEAQICWNCHASNAISEWGANQNPVTGNYPYNYGQLYTTSATTAQTSNWIGAWWKSGTTAFAYKTGLIQSTHSANPAGAPWNGPTAAGVDTVAQIRCSYCHDVHDLNRAPGDAATGKPYLRGSWKGNPYKEDGAPQAGTAYTNLTRFGAVPRGNITQTTMGGYWIDQNSTNPTNGFTLANSAGLCTLCHGSNVNILNQFGTAANNAWIGSNGHANAVIGGTGLGAANIFDLRGGVLGNNANPAMAFLGANEPGDNGRFGYRNTEGSAAGWTPLISPAGRTHSYQNYQWGATVNANTIDVQYHKFSCSKCHNPHASRLPRLLITNCLDTKHNTWDNNYQLATGTNAGSNNLNRSISNWTSAQNCHRLGGIDPSDTRADAAGTGAGWNRVSPWTVTGTQDNGIIP